MIFFQTSLKLSVYQSIGLSVYRSFSRILVFFCRPFYEKLSEGEKGHRALTIMVRVNTDFVLPFWLWLYACGSSPRDPRNRRDWQTRPVNKRFQGVKRCWTEESGRSS